jgi:hypothetical protein
LINGYHCFSDELRDAIALKKGIAYSEEPFDTIEFRTDPEVIWVVKNLIRRGIPVCVGPNTDIFYRTIPVMLVPYASIVYYAQCCNESECVEIDMIRAQSDLIDLALLNNSVDSLRENHGALMDAWKAFNAVELHPYNPEEDDDEEGTNGDIPPVERPPGETMALREYLDRKMDQYRWVNGMDD